MFPGFQEFTRTADRKNVVSVSKTSRINKNTTTIRSSMRGSTETQRRFRPPPLNKQSMLFVTFLLRQILLQDITPDDVLVTPQWRAMLRPNYAHAREGHTWTTACVREQWPPPAETTATALQQHRRPRLPPLGPKHEPLTAPFSNTTLPDYQASSSLCPQKTRCGGVMYIVDCRGVRGRGLRGDKHMMQSFNLAFSRWPTEVRGLFLCTVLLFSLCPIIVHLLYHQQNRVSMLLALCSTMAQATLFHNSGIR